MHSNIAQHFLETNFNKILRTSWINAGAHGVDLFNLEITDDRATRIVSANENHELWHNNGTLKMSIPVLTASADTTVEAIYGNVAIIFPTVKKMNVGEEPVFLNQYSVDDVNIREIPNSKRAFHGFSTEYWKWADGSSTVFIPKGALYAMFVPKGDSAIWAWYEAAAEPISEIVYSNQSPTEFVQGENIWIHMTSEYILQFMESTFGI